MWIETVAPERAQGKLKKLYERVKGPNGEIDNILRAHALRPHTLEGHMALYKNVLHHSANRVPKWLLEALGVYVSHLNGCEYCVAHHYEGMRRLLDDGARAERIREAIEVGRPEDVFRGAELAACRYAAILTRDPSRLEKADVDRMRDAGLDDGQILEINQVVAYFAYANRTVLGLGIDLAGEVLGLSPGDSDDPDNWHHQEART